MSQLQKVVIVGGNGKIAKRLTRLLTQAAPGDKPLYHVTSIIRSESQTQDIMNIAPGYVTPRVISVENAPKEEFTEVFEGAKLVYFTAGAGGKAGENGEAAAERTRKVDWLGAVKVFDAIDDVQGTKPRLILISSVDLRNPSDPAPDHYNAQDLAMSERYRKFLSNYFDCKYKADQDLVKRTAFNWTIVRLGELKDDPATGKVSLGNAHLLPVTRDDVAAVLYQLAAREGAEGLAMDVVNGNDPIDKALDVFIANKQTDYA